MGYVLVVPQVKRQGCGQRLGKKFLEYVTPFYPTPVIPVTNTLWFTTTAPLADEGGQRGGAGVCGVAG